ncbi:MULTISPECIES: GGDEF domain-containing protein [Colwellia]|uniref:diguanylate cyclase n=1 Tax=Colwellia marinimaniae TaxID=1513592 RepID=A0ABQ0MXC0_9GAMM|nr:MULTISPECIES: GGDEF domain-containing protein [Colwellia]GAW97013.1 GGDEF domain-containing protein [Colwellia marinimaniae]
MQKVKETQGSGELYGVMSLLLLTLIISVLLFLNIEKVKSIDLHSADIKVIDDSSVLGASIAKVVKTNQGLEFSCQLKKSHLDQPYCQLIINVQDLSKQAPFTGLDLSSYEKIGLWIQHNHPTQPGTRIELRNFNADYSLNAEEKSLKYNSLEYLEAYVSNPVWLTLNDFYIPQWWHNSHNLALTHGGTDFANIYSIVIAPSTTVAAGNYKITLERIEFKGKYVSSTTLISILIAIWSLALGYLIHRASRPKERAAEVSAQPAPAIAFGAQTDALTGALNRIGLRKCFDQLAPTDLQNLSIIFFNLDDFSDLYPKYGQQMVDKLLQQFVKQINSSCRSSDTIARWNSEEFLLVCPDTSLAQAMAVADKIRASILATAWPNDIQLSCSSGVAQMHDEDLNDLIARANKALYKAKNTGSNRTAAA